MWDSRHFVRRISRKAFGPSGNQKREDHEGEERKACSKRLGLRRRARGRHPIGSHGKPTRAPQHGRECASLRRGGRAHAAFRTSPPIG
jgi:hypothetical protein